MERLLIRESFAGIGRIDPAFEQAELFKIMKFNFEGTLKLIALRVEGIRHFVFYFLFING